MKKIIKISMVMLIICSFMFAQNTQGEFGVVVGQVVKFRINEAEIDIAYESITDTFNGVTISEAIAEESTIIKVMVESITASELKWNSSYGLIPLEGTCPTMPVQNDFLDFLLISTVFYMDVNIPQIYSTGVIDPMYFEPFLLPLFLDTAPATWDAIEVAMTSLESFLPSLFGGFADDLDYGSTFSRDNETLSFLLWHYVYDFQSASPLAEMEWNCTSSFSYDITTGILLEADSHMVMNGSYTGDNYVINTDYNVEKTDMSDFMEFLNKYKWYFAGGGAGLIVIISTIAILVRVRRKR